MQKKKLLLIPIVAGLILIVLSWWESYPLGATTLKGVVFDQISPLYWIGMPILLFSLFIFIIFLKNDSLKCLATFILIMSMYSLFYFYYSSPGSDSHQFIGLSEYFIKTGDLTPIRNHLYYEYPFFFVLAKIAVDVSGISLPEFEAVFYTAVGFLMAGALYAYFSSRYKKGAFLAVTAFFIPMFYFLNYQYAPFTLGFALLLVSMMLETTLVETRGKMVASILVFTAIVFTHPFVPVFFLLYVLIMYVLTRKIEHLRIFILTTVIYLLVQIWRAPQTFFSIIRTLIGLAGGSEYSGIAQQALAPASASVDKIAQSVSRPLVIVVVVVSGFCFLYTLMKKKGLFSRAQDKSILFSGLLYSVAGVFVSVLGSRAIPLAFVPVLLGIAYMYESKFKIPLIAVFAIAMILFISLPIHSSFYDAQTMYQTQEAYQAENFMVNTFNWTHPSLMLAHVRVVTYIVVRQPSNASYESDYSDLFPRFQDYDAILYTIGLGKNMLKYNATIQSVIQQDRLNVVYDNGFSMMTLKNSNFTWAPTR